MEGPVVLANRVSSQLDHETYGGVIPELASRLHQQLIVPVVEEALKQAGKSLQDLDAVAFTQGPGLLGALMVGTCFAKSLALGLDLPLIAVNHMEAHVLANFLLPKVPAFPFICLTVSGGHTQLVLVRDYLDMAVIGQTIDDAAGEAFDKAAKMLGLPYPGGPQIDRLAREGDPHRFDFPVPEVERFAFSFSGLKTSLLYLAKRELAKDPAFLQKEMAHLCASYQHRIVRILIDKLRDAGQTYGVKHLAIAGGVSANSELRRAFQALCDEEGWAAFIPPFEYCTDNAAMIGMVGVIKYRYRQFADLSVRPFARTP